MIHQEHKDEEATTVQEETSPSPNLFSMEELKERAAGRSSGDQASGQSLFDSLVEEHIERSGVELDSSPSPKKERNRLNSLNPEEQVEAEVDYAVQNSGPSLFKRCMQIVTTGACIAGAAAIWTVGTALSFPVQVGATVALGITALASAYYFRQKNDTTHYAARGVSKAELKEFINSCNPRFSSNRSFGYDLLVTRRG